MEGSKGYKRAYSLYLENVVEHIGVSACGPVHANLSWDLNKAGQRHGQTTAPDGNTYPRIRSLRIAARDQGFFKFRLAKSDVAREAACSQLLQPPVDCLAKLWVEVGAVLVLST